MDEMQYDEAMSNTPKRNPRTPFFVGLIIVLLAAAAFVGGRLLNSAATPGNAGGGLQIVTGGGDGVQDFALSVQIEPAPELPDTPPDVTGIFSRLEDNSVFVNSGSGEFGIFVSEDGSVQTTGGDSGEETEIVVTAETQVYKDATTPPNPSEGAPSGTIQQKAEPATIDQLGQNSFVSAWGQRRGDRLIADVLFFSEPIFFQRPAP
jgi:hypothetical protein